MSTYSITCMTPDQTGLWNGFVESADNGTVFHRVDFLAYHGEVSGRRDIMVWDGDELCGIMPLRLRQEGGATMAYSPWGGSFGGLVTRAARAAHLAPMCMAIREYLQEEGVCSLVLSCPPTAYAHTNGVAQEYFMLRSFPSIALQCARVTSVIEIGGHGGISQNVKRNAAHARKQGVTVVEHGDPAAMYALLRRTIEEKHGATITHSEREFLYLAENLPDHFRIFMAEADGSPQAGIVLLENNSPCSMAFYNGHDHDGVRGALHFLFLEVLEHCAQAGKRYLDLGATSMASKPVNEGLFRFKEGLGSHLIYRNTYALALAEGGEAR